MTETPEQIEKKRAKWREKAKRQRAKRKALGIKPKDRTEYIKAYREKNRGKINAYRREWSEKKRRGLGIAKRNGPMTKEQLREWHKNWDAEHREERRESVRRYRERSPEKIAAYRNRYNSENRELLRLRAEKRRRAKGVKPKPPKLTATEHSRLYRSRHPGKAKSIDRACREKYREKYNARGRRNTYKRRMRKANIPGSHTEEQWLGLCAIFQNKCVRCGVSNENSKLQRDHVIPITKPGSTDYISNIQPLCKSCNSSKLNKITDYRSTPFIGVGIENTAGDITPPLITISALEEF